MHGSAAESSTQLLHLHATDNSNEICAGIAAIYTAFPMDSILQQQIVMFWVQK